MTIQNKVDETIGTLCDRIQEKVKENSICTEELVALVSALAELTLLFRLQLHISQLNYSE